MQSLRKYNKGIKYFLCVVDIFSKYIWVVPLKDKTGISINNVFREIISKEENQIKCGLFKAVNFTISFLKDV